MKKLSFASFMIARSDAEAEALIGRVRIFVAFIIFIAIATLMNIVPAETFVLREGALKAALAVSFLYTLLGLVSFLVARSKFYKPVYGLLFALTEVALVLGNVLANVISPDTPSLFALASPLLLVVVIVLVVQVLRYSLAVHMTVSVTMFVGLVIVLLTDPQVGAEPSDRLVAELLNLYSVPPNVMRLFLLSLLAGIIALAIYRSRQLMERIAHELEESQNRNRFLPQELTTQLGDEDIDRLRTGHVRNVVIMFVDLRGFTPMSQTLPPEQTARMLSDYRSIVMNSVSSRQGIIDKFMGDGVMCVFGLEESFGQAARNAVNSVCEIDGLMKKWNRKRDEKGETMLEPVYAIGGGDALIAALGPDERLEFTAIGPVVNTVARMEEYAKANDIRALLSANIRDALASETPSKTPKNGPPVCENLGATTFRGESQETGLYALQLDNDV